MCNIWTDLCKVMHQNLAYKHDRNMRACPVYRCGPESSAYDQFLLVDIVHNKLVANIVTKNLNNLELSYYSMV